MNNQPPHVLDREREREREREIEEQQIRERHMRQEEIVQREREHNERERQHREQQQYQSVPQHQNNTGTIPIHQPVASRLPGAIHSPGGLLANHGASAQSGQLGAPPGPGNTFGGPLHAEGNRSLQQHSQQNAITQQQHQIFGPSLLNHPAASAAPHGTPVGPSTVFGGPLQQDAAARVMQQVPFGGPMGSGHQIPGAPALGQGQQPILNVSDLF
jgi:paired amphipathic helix protein Sin3a